MAKKIKISKALFDSAISLLEELDIDDFSPEIIQLHGYVLHAFKNKKTSVGLRGAHMNQAGPGEGRPRPEGPGGLGCHHCVGAPF